MMARAGVGSRTEVEWWQSGGLQRLRGSVQSIVRPGIQRGCCGRLPSSLVAERSKHECVFTGHSSKSQVRPRQR